jgi:hypothetical protein
MFVYIHFLFTSEKIDFFFNLFTRDRIDCIYLRVIYGF